MPCYELPAQNCLIKLNITLNIEPPQQAGKTSASVFLITALKAQGNVSAIQGKTAVDTVCMQDVSRERQTTGDWDGGQGIWEGNRTLSGRVGDMTKSLFQVSLDRSFQVKFKFQINSSVTQLTYW